MTPDDTPDPHTLAAAIRARIADGWDPTHAPAYLDLATHLVDEALDQWIAVGADKICESMVLRALVAVAARNINNNVRQSALRRFVQRDRANQRIKRGSAINSGCGIEPRNEIRESFV